MHVCKVAWYHSAEAKHGAIKQESPDMDAMLMTSTTRHLPEVQAY